MADRALRALSALCLLVSLAGCAGGPGADPAPPPPAAAAPAVSAVRVLQLNLCNSGIASCFTGRATTTAAAVIRTEAPDLVTLNEICRDDLAALVDAMDDRGAATSAFQAARDARTGAPYRCRNGSEYGIGVLARWPQPPGAAPNGGIYPAQDGDDPEQRAWLCLDAASTPAVTVCTTHLAYTRTDVALAQCRHLFGTVVAQARARSAVVLGADLNLGDGDDPRLRSCLPAGFALAGDGGQQHVVGTPGFAVDGTRSVDMRGSTDHPGLLVTLRR